jgi:hypothetical protein
MSVEVYSSPYMFTRSGLDQKPIIHISHVEARPGTLELLEKTLNDLSLHSVDDFIKLRAQLLFFLSS